ncbi:MAG TPA: putative nucleotidyltransferase substrate binding domain-containing protein [Solirubrobacterales bacterium]|nr:putative nucleotidyltransferase substrate binding domain-containing protein [Solirubrobacterales bacterium]
MAEFLRRYEPFGDLGEEALERLAERSEVEFFAAGTVIFTQGERPQTKVRVVRKGSIELLDRGRVLDLLGEGELFGHPSMLSGLPTGFEARAHEDSLVYALAAPEVLPLLARPSSLPYLARSLLRRRKPGGADDADVASAETAQQSARDLIRREPVIGITGLTLREAAQRMVDEGVSSMLIRRNDDELGILTDSDLRRRVAAGDVSVDAPVETAMTSPIVTVQADQTGADVMLAMLENDIRHVPVVSARSEVLGMIVGIDLVAAEARTPFLLRRAISEANSKEELRDAAARLRSTVIALHRAELAPWQLSQVISAVSDALITRMIELAIESTGEPPTQFSWLALGSHGRREPVPASDVDSGMAWQDDSGPAASNPRRTLSAAETRRYMRAIAADVAACLRVVGWRLDPHGVTASDEFSASSIGEWRSAIERWLGHPEDERVLIATSILLDGRVIYGPDDLDPKRFFLESRHRTTLERWMLRLALATKPPTGFMRNIVVEHSGEHRGTFDIKHGGLLPIVDLARYAGLKAGTRVTATPERLRVGAEAGVFTNEQARTLDEAYDLFAELRMEHQVQQLERGQEPDDHLDPKQLNSLTRRYLRDAFREVASIQKSFAAELTWGP